MVSMTEREERELQKALLQELVDIMPENRPKTEIEFDFREDFWDLNKIMLAIKKICEEHDGKRGLHIRFSGGLKRLES